MTERFKTYNRITALMTKAEGILSVVVVVVIILSVIVIIPFDIQNP